MSFDWFEPALQGSGSLAAGFERVIAMEECKLQFVRCLKAAVLSPVPHAPDRIALLHQDVKVLDQTLQLRLGMLAMDRPQAWFRHSPATERGPFAATVYEEPIFTRFEEQRAVSIRHLLPELWRTGQLSCEAYDPSNSVWGRLLLLKKKFAQLNQLPHPFADLTLDELPEALPDELQSPSLQQYTAQLNQRMRGCFRDLEGCFQMLWARSESFLYALHLQHLSARARASQENGKGRGEGAAREGASRGRQDPGKARGERTSRAGAARESEPKVPSALVAALQFMNFAATPPFSELRARYRIMAHSLHPDRGGDENKFKLLTQHYQEILSTLTRG